MGMDEDGPGVSGDRTATDGGGDGGGASAPSAPVSSTGVVLSMAAAVDIRSLPSDKSLRSSLFYEKLMEEKRQREQAAAEEEDRRLAAMTPEERDKHLAEQKAAQRSAMKARSNSIHSLNAYVSSSSKRPVSMRKPAGAAAVSSAVSPSKQRPGS